MPMIVSSCWTTVANTVLCTLHDCLCSKVRFRHTCTVTRSHSFSEKNYAYASRTSCLMYTTPEVILLNSPLSNIISESVCFAQFLAKCTQKGNKLCSFSKRNLGTTCQVLH